MPLDGTRSPAGSRRTAPGSAAAPAPVTERATGSENGTNVQEAGVDEPDVVKTDGSLLVRVEDGDLATYDVTGDRAGAPLDDRPARAARHRDPAGRRPGGRDRARAGRLRRRAESHPGPGRRPGRSGGAGRRRRGRLRHRPGHGAAARRHRPTGPGPRAPRPAVRAAAEVVARRGRRRCERNREIVRESTLEDWLPSVTRDDETEPAPRLRRRHRPRRRVRTGHPGRGRLRPGHPGDVVRRRRRDRLHHRLLLDRPDVPRDHGVPRGLGRALLLRG